MTVLLALLLHGQVGADGPSTAEAIDMLERVTKGIFSYDLEIAVTHRHLSVSEVVAWKREEGFPREVPVFRFRLLQPGEEPRIGRGLYRQVYSRGRKRTEYLDPDTRKPTHLFSSDGEVDRGLNTQTGIGHLQNRTIQIPDGVDYMTFYRDAFNGICDLALIFRQRPETRVSVDPEGRIVIDSPPCKPGQNRGLVTTGYRIHMHPAYGLMPEVLERYEGNRAEDSLEMRIKVNRFIHTSGIWVPVNVTTTRFFVKNHGKELVGKPGFDTTAEVKLQNSRWNIDIPDQTFALPFPVGTKVADRLRNAIYTTGQPDPGTNLRALAKGAKHFVVSSGDDEIFRMAVPWWRTAIFYWLCVAIGILALAVFSFWYWRKKGPIRA